MKKIIMTNDCDHRLLVGYSSSLACFLRSQYEDFYFSERKIAVDDDTVTTTVYNESSGELMTYTAVDIIENETCLHSLDQHETEPPFATAVKYPYKFKARDIVLHKEHGQGIVIDIEQSGSRPVHVLYPHIGAWYTPTGQEHVGSGIAIKLDPNPPVIRPGALQDLLDSFS